MNSFIDKANLDWAQAALNCPQVEVLPGSSLVLSHFQVAADQELRFLYLGLHLVKYTTLGGTGRRTTGLPAVYAGLYSGLVLTPSAQPLVYAGTDLPGLVLAPKWVLTAPGNYTVLLVNNSASRAASMTLALSTRLVGV